MKICNKDCKYFAPLKNTDECNMGICIYGSNYTEAELNKNCLYYPKEYTCVDCDHFANDFACFTAKEDDKPCCGFVSIKETELFNILYDWKLRGIDIQKKVNKIIFDVNSEFKPLD